MPLGARPGQPTFTLDPIQNPKSKIQNPGA
jgi:hypothetical protein